MAGTARRCTEWHPDSGCTPITRLNQQTCSTACRSKRARRLKAAKKKAAAKISAAKTLPEHLQHVSQVANRTAKDVGHELLKEEMRPVVREAITDDVLKGIHDLVALTPRMVQLIERDMESSDPTISQKAYTLLARYTLGNASVAPAPTAVQPSPMQVVFQLPRQGDAPAHLVEGQGDELKDCTECAKPFPLTEFVDGSNRCRTCHDEMQAKIDARFA